MMGNNERAMTMMAQEKAKNSEIQKGGSEENILMSQFFGQFFSRSPPIEQNEWD